MNKLSKKQLQTVTAGGPPSLTVPLKLTMKSGPSS